MTLDEFNALGLKVGSQCRIYLVDDPEPLNCWLHARPVSEDALNRIKIAVFGAGGKIQPTLVPVSQIMSVYRVCRTCGRVAPIGKRCGRCALHGCSNCIPGRLCRNCELLEKHNADEDGTE